MSRAIGRPKPPQTDSAKEIERDAIEIPVVKARLLQQLEPVDDAAPAAAAADLGAAQLHREHAVALEADVGDGDLLTRQLLAGGGFGDRRAGLAAEQTAGGVGFRIAADQQHPLALLGHHASEIGEREGFADPALAIDRDDPGVLGDFVADGQGHRLRRLGARARGHAAQIGDVGAVRVGRARAPIIVGIVRAAPFQSRITLGQAGSPNAARHASAASAARIHRIHRIGGRALMGDQT
jgi:hypothetical protein